MFARVKPTFWSENCGASSQLNGSVNHHHPAPFAAEIDRSTQPYTGRLSY